MNSTQDLRRKQRDSANRIHQLQSHLKKLNKTTNKKDKATDLKKRHTSKKLAEERATFGRLIAEHKRVTEKIEAKTPLFSSRSEIVYPIEQLEIEVRDRFIDWQISRATENYRTASKKHLDYDISYSKLEDAARRFGLGQAITPTDKYGCADCYTYRFIYYCRCT
jgi:hypothetical protein